MFASSSGLRFWRRGSCLLLALFGLASGQTAHAGASGPLLTLNPSTITNDFVGEINLNITGLGGSGQTVIIEKFQDTNNNGSIDSGDLMVGSYQVTDGQVTSIGGRRNLNVPGDEDGAADGNLQVKLYYSTHEVVGRQDGRVIFRVSPASGTSFVPFTANLMVTQKDYGGSGISGTVKAAGSPVPFATVLFAVSSGSGDQNIVGLTLADGSGNFSMNLKAGTYSLRGKSPGYVHNSSGAASIDVAAGTMVGNQIVTLTPGGRTISGTVRDAGGVHQPLPGVLLSGQSQTGAFSFTFSDASGNFVCDASAEPWQFDSDEYPFAMLGFLKLKLIEGSTSSVTGYHYDVPRATALVYGNLSTSATPPVAVSYTEVATMQLGGAGANTDAVTDANGNYTLGVTTGSWDVSVPVVPNAVVLDQNPVVNNAGTAVLQDLVADVAGTHLRGVVKDDSGNTVPNLPIYANDLNSNSNSTDVNGTTDSNGNFDLTVFGGINGGTRTWGIGILFNSHLTQTYIGSTPQFQVQDSVDQNNITYLVHAITAYASGQVLDENNAPIGNIAIFANLNTQNTGPGNGGNSNLGWNTGIDVDASGNFANLPFFAGSWTFGLSNIQGLGLIPQMSPITVVDGDNQTKVKVYAHHANATIAGTVKDQNKNPVAGVQVFANSTGAGSGGYSTSAMTDNNGHYALPAFSGNWNVSLNNNGNGNLPSLGYMVPPDQTPFVGTANVTVNFVVQETGVTTSAAAGITSTGATLNASFDVNGNSLATSFDWGTSATALTHNLAGSPDTANGGMLTAVTASLDFLSPNTTYYFRAVGDADFAKAYGATLSFKTLAATGSLPTVITLAASNITASGATLNGSVNAKGLTTQVGFEGGTTTAYGGGLPATPSPVIGTAVTLVSSTASGLLAHTTYHFRSKAMNSAGGVNGADRTFKTLDNPPAATADSFVVLPGAKATLDVLANDSDPDGDTLSILSFKQPASGGAVAKVGGTLLFTAAPTFAATTTFTYVVSDGFGGTSTGTVTLNPGTCSLPSPPMPPPAAGASYTIAVTATGAWSVSNALSWVSVSPPSGVGNGSVTVTLLPNTSTSLRSGTITIGGKAYLVSQAGVLTPTIATPATIPPAIVSGFYSLAIPTTNAPVTYTVTGLPKGLSINQATGVISGTPTVGGVTSHVTVSARNAAGPAGPLPPFDITVQSLPLGTVGTFDGLIKREPVLNGLVASRLGLTTNANGSFTGKIITGVTAQSIAGQLIAVPAASGQLPNPVECRVSIPRAGNPPLTLDVFIDGATNSLSGTLSDGGSNSSGVNAWRNTWISTNLPTVYQTYYTFSLQQTDTSPGFPQGYGYGSFTVAATTGTLTASGKLADGSAFSTGTFVGPQGQVLIYQPLYSNKGSFVGALTVTTGAHPVNNTISGSPSWYKPLPTVATTDTIYATGFGPIHLTANGGGYVVPTAGLVVMGLNNVAGNAQLAFALALSGPPLSVPVSITNPSLTGLVNKVNIPSNPDNVTMTVLTPSTGAFSGSITASAGPASSATVTYQGLIVYQSGVAQGYGYFLLPQIGITPPIPTAATAPKRSISVLLGAAPP